MSKPIQEILSEVWGYSVFRPMQEEIINSVLGSHDTLALLPTGGGKSICYQVPALAREGICIVVSPLIALMKDQVINLQKRNVKAAAIFSGMSYREIDITLDNCVYGDYKLLYVSPERLKTELFIERVKQMNVNLVAVDEAHCISQWGYDFRPSYLEIAEFKKYLNDTPILALTATATPEVRKDICEKLEFGNEKIFVKSFSRNNLSYLVIHEEGKINRLKRIFQKVQGCGIVYVRSRKKTQQVAEALWKSGIKAGAYHAGLDFKTRNKRQEMWMKNDIRVMVCTNAFGMGIDKPDVRAVVHLELPDSPEAYYQEAGRAGRDEQPAYATLLYNYSDKADMDRRMANLFPENEEVVKVYHCLGNYFRLAVGSGENESYHFDLLDFANQYQLKPVLVHKCLKVLEQQNLVANSEGVFMSSRIKMTVDNETIYKFEIANESYESLVKMILRTTPGVFDHYTQIDEKRIARYINSTSRKVYEQLKYMEKCALLNYEVSTNKPRITFLTPRLADNNIMLDTALLEKRKKINEEKMNAMVEYASDLLHCRQQQLMAYFGEFATTRCGNCDICLKRNKLAMTEIEYEEVISKIRENLDRQPMPITTLISCLDTVEEEKTLKTVKWLVDTGQLNNSDNCLTWNN